MKAAREFPTRISEKETQRHYFVTACGVLNCRETVGADIIRLQAFPFGEGVAVRRRMRFYRILIFIVGRGLGPAVNMAHAVLNRRHRRGGYYPPADKPSPLGKVALPQGKDG